jgi:hypothetical protein
MLAGTFLNLAQRCTMPRGTFSQGMTLLTNGQTTLRGLEKALQADSLQITKQVPAQSDWRFGGPTLIVPFRPEVNGYAAVDVVDQPWPDSMGDPKTDAQTFAAWGMGQFGPFTFPGGLARACQHAWAWQAGRAVAEKHRGFIRVRLSYCFGAKEDAPMLPDDYDPWAEMNFLSRVVLALFKASGILCYFNPGGEVLRDEAGFADVWHACQEQQNIPLPLWMNVRFFNVSPELGLMDTVGNAQLDLQDAEAVFPLRSYAPGDIDYYLRNATHYLMSLDRPLKAGEDIDGPGESNLSWTMETPEQGAVDPPRRVLRLFPKSDTKKVQAALSALSSATSPRR